MQSRWALLIGGGIDGFQGQKSNLVWKSKLDQYWQVRGNGGYLGMLMESV